jgi:hypothetical protein
MDRRLALAPAIAAGDRLEATLADDVGVAAIAASDSQPSIATPAVADENAVVVLAGVDAARGPLATVAIGLAKASAVAIEPAMRDRDIIHAAACCDLQPAERATSDAHAAIAGQRFANSQASFDAAIAKLDGVTTRPQIATNGADTTAGRPRSATVDLGAVTAGDLPPAVAELLAANVVSPTVTRNAKISIR